MRDMTYASSSAFIFENSSLVIVPSPGNEKIIYRLEPFITILEN
jgi:hypothetical protein